MIDVATNSTQATPIHPAFNFSWGEPCNVMYTAILCIPSERHAVFVPRVPVGSIMTAIHSDRLVSSF